MLMRNKGVHEPEGRCVAVADRMLASSLAAYVGKVMVIERGAGRWALSVLSESRAGAAPPRLNEKVCSKGSEED
jgi:hypothetical protein